MENLSLNLSYINHYRLSSNSHVKKPNNSLSYNCQKIFSFVRSSKAIFHKVFTSGLLSKSEIADLPLLEMLFAI